MTKGIAQLRYYGNKHANNWPQKSPASVFTSGSAFESYYPIVDLKIHSSINSTSGGALSFRINGNDNNVILLPNEKFELNLEDFGYIY